MKKIYCIKPSNAPMIAFENEVSYISAKVIFRNNNWSFASFEASIIDQ